MAGEDGGGSKKKINIKLGHTSDRRSSHGVFPSPFASKFIVSLPIRFVYSSNLGDQRIVRVRITQQRANRQQH